MSIGLVGIKLGMSRFFTKDGKSVPVTVIHALPNLICQIKTEGKDGYNALQVAVGKQKPQRISKALRGHYGKNRIPAAKKLKEFKVASDKAGSFSTGDTLNLLQFFEGQRVDAIGVSKGKGFAGTIKRWNFSSQDATHGNSISHRHPGSTGQCQFPGKVWKGKKMSGQYGNCRSTTLRLQVVSIDKENNLLLIKGAVPGANGGEVVVRPSLKQTLEEISLMNKFIEEQKTDVSIDTSQKAESKEVKEKLIKPDERDNAKINKSVEEKINGAVKEAPDSNKEMVKSDDVKDIKKSESQPDNEDDKKDES